MWHPTTEKVAVVVLNVNWTLKLIFYVTQRAGPREGDARGEGPGQAGAPGDYPLLQRLAGEPPRGLAGGDGPEVAERRQVSIGFLKPVIPYSSAGRTWGLLFGEGVHAKKCNPPLRRNYGISDIYYPIEFTSFGSLHWLITADVWMPQDEKCIFTQACFQQLKSGLFTTLFSLLGQIRAKSSTR